MELNKIYNEDNLETMAKMSILNERNYIGSEISQEYCTIAEKRIQDTIKELSQKPNSLF